MFPSTADFYAEAFTVTFVSSGLQPHRTVAVTITVVSVFANISLLLGVGITSLDMRIAILDDIVLCPKSNVLNPLSSVFCLLS